MQSLSHLRTSPVFLFGNVAVWAALAIHAGAQNVQHLSVPIAGGLPGIPTVTAVTPVQGGVKVSWDGPQGYYQLFEAGSWKNPLWWAVGRHTNLVRMEVVPGASKYNAFAVAGPQANYGGSQSCVACHSPLVHSEAATQHAAAFSDPFFASEGGLTNRSCWVCHSVGLNAPTGFVNKKTTPNLAGVQCENCHGPAALHAANPLDPTARPRVEIAATVCGGCHQGFNQPTFPEWQSSEHATVTEDMNAPNRISNCGRCHSGSARHALINSLAMPTGDANMGVVCITCHDPHQKTGHLYQLRYPQRSTNDYFMPASGAFLSYYNPNINVCGQCHNHAGASWQTTANPPHPSPQYNILIGTGGALDPGTPHSGISSHGFLITNQCAGCHMQSAASTATSPAITGHTFRVERYDICAKCHVSPEAFAATAMNAASNRVVNLKLDLDYWAQEKAPASLWKKYGKRSWEYSSPGDLSPGGPGPTANEQVKYIPANVRKARYNLYLVLGDGSFSIHNPHYVNELLDAGEQWLYEEFYPDQ